MEPQSDGLVEAEVRRSGFVDWDASAADGQGMELVLLPLLWLANWCTHLLVFRGGWTLRIIHVGHDVELLSKT